MKKLRKVYNESDMKKVKLYAEEWCGTGCGFSCYGKNVGRNCGNACGQSCSN